MDYYEHQMEEPDADFFDWAEANPGGTWAQYCQAIADGWERTKIELSPREVGVVALGGAA